MRVLRPARVAVRDYDGQVAAILAWVHRHIYYTNEAGEQIQTPDWTVKVGNGDCDDLAVLTATLAESIGLKTRFVLGGRLQGRAIRYVEGSKVPQGAQFEHIYLEIGTPALQPNRWTVVEPTVPGVKPGYDVITRGMPVAAHRGGPPVARLGAASNAATTYDEPEPGSIWDRLDPVSLLPEVITGVVVAMATGFVLDVLARRRKAR